MENNKTQAEIYREERKERLAKAAAKKAKKSPAVEKTKKIITKVVAIVLAVVIGVGAVYATLNFFGLPQKMIKVTVADTECKFSLAEYNYYYYTLVSQYQSQAYEIESYYGEGAGLTYLGYDYTKTPEAQEYTEELASMTGITFEDLGNPEKATWADVFRFGAINNIVSTKYLAMKAEEAGITLTEAEQKTIDDRITSDETTAKKGDYSLDRYLHVNIGKGLSEKIYRQILEETTLANSYTTKLQEDTLDAITEEEINERYNLNKDNFDIVTVRMYTIKATANVASDATEAEKKDAQDKAKAQAKKDADAFLAAVTDEESFIAQAKNAILNADNNSKDDADKVTLKENTTFATLKNTSEDLAKWVYDDARQAGDKNLFVDEDGNCHLVFVKVLPAKDMSTSSSDVRHLLVAFPETEKDENGKEIELTDAQKAETKKKAQEILDEYLKNPTLENFVALTKEHTDDVDSEGKPNGDGLYEEVADNGQYVEEFTNWAIDPARKPGETGLVETDYGYHIMYYVEANEATWFVTVKDEIFAEKLAAQTDDVIIELMKNTKIDSLFINWTTSQQNDLFAKQLLYSGF
mgnify:CR=1 FL=1